MFLLNLQSKIPLQEQIKNQMIRFIEVGILKEEDRLPSIRQLAQDNGINPNTVMKSYSELEKQGFVYNVPKKGVYVAKINVQQSLESEILNFLRPFQKNGMKQEQLEAIIQKLYREEKNA